MNGFLRMSVIAAVFETETETSHSPEIDAVIEVAIRTGFVIGFVVKVLFETEDIDIE